MKFSDMNCVAPRVTELIDLGLVVETGDTICPVTGKRVRLVAAAIHAPTAVAVPATTPVTSKQESLF